MIGSHIDTVVDAGRYDGGLGVLAAIAVVAELARTGERLDHAVEVAAFGEEEGSRFSAHILTSSALIGAVKPALLDTKDADGISVREALAAAGGDAKAYRACARKKGEIAAYLELHIEQGPVLEAKGLALGAVTAINGSVRSLVAGHGLCRPRRHRADGRAPRCARRGQRDDPWPSSGMAAAEPELVATVGRVKVLPGARTSSRVASSSPSTCAVRPMPCATAPTRRLLAELAHDRQAARRRHRHRYLPGEPGRSRSIPASSMPWARPSPPAGRSRCACPPAPGHDAGIMAKHCPSGMIFLRCKDGISHNPAESITVADADLGVRALLEAVRRLDRRLG